MGKFDRLWTTSLSLFRRDSRGNFAMMGALVAVPLVLAIGGAIDVSLLYSNKLRIQASADAAALAAAKQYPTDPSHASLAKHASNVFNGNIGKLFRTEAELVYDGTSWTEDHSRELKLHVEFAYQPLFLPVSILSVAQSTRIDSAVMVSDTTVEVAMVLDTSGSMASSPAAGGAAKIDTLRTTARSAAEKFFAASGTGNLDPTSVAIVPFAGSVNVGADKLDLWWMDPKGVSPIHHENFDWKTLTDHRGNPLATQALDKSWFLTANPATKLTRQYVFKNAKAATLVLDRTICTYKLLTYPGCTWTGADKTWEMKLLGASICKQTADMNNCHPYRVTYAAKPLYDFRGCVEARPGIAGITDIAPDPAKPETLFVPYMAVDEPDLIGDNSYLRDNDYEFPKAVFPFKKASTYAAQQAEFFPHQMNMNKYLLAPLKYRNEGAFNHLYTPNFICDTAPILPLSTDKGTVDAMIDGLKAEGATNVDEGVGWGWRVLSPGEPYAGSRAFTDEKNVKALILMTDGENTYYEPGYDENQNKSRFGSYGFSQVKSGNSVKGGRIFEESGRSVQHTASNFTLAMDGRTRKVCTNARNDGATKMTDVNGATLVDERGQVQRDGIQIFTIAFDIPAASKARVDALLSDCASWRIDDLRNTSKPYSQKAKNFYSVANARDLDAAFSDIVASLSRMRISH